MNGPGKVLAHGVTGGITAELQGESFGHGFFSAGLSKLVMGQFKYKDTNWGAIAGRTTVAAAVGGTISEVTGGKFANGARTAAMAHLLNAEGGAIKKRLAQQTNGREAGKVYVTGHRVGGVGPVHTAIRYTDANGLVTFSAAPAGGLLVSNLGRPSDTSANNFTVDLVTLPQGVTAQNYVASLTQADSNYCDCVDYDLFPGIADGYNSNSYVQGLLNATGGTISVNLGDYYGGNDPLPSRYFRSSP